MNTTTLIRSAVPLVCALGLTANCPAAVIGYTDYAAFTTAIAGMQSTTEDFEPYTTGATIADGATVGGIRYDYDFGGDELSVSDIYDTTSPSHFLGTTDTLALIYDGETAFSLAFDAVNAVGMFFITADPLFDGDIELAGGNATVTLATGDLVETLADDSAVYFLGLVDNGAATLTGVAIRTATVGVFGYNIDDIVRATKPTVVSIPGSIPLLLLGMAAATVATRRQRMRERKSRPL